MARVLFGVLVTAMLGATGFYTYEYFHGDCPCSQQTEMVKKNCCAQECAPGTCCQESAATCASECTASGEKKACCDKEGACCKDGEKKCCDGEKKCDGNKDEAKVEAAKDEPKKEEKKD